MAFTQEEIDKIKAAGLKTPSLNSVGTPNSQAIPFSERRAQYLKDNPTSSTVDPLATPGYRIEENRKALLKNNDVFGQGFVGNTLRKVSNFGDDVANTINDFTGVGDLAVKGYQAMTGLDPKNKFAPSKEQTEAAALKAGSTALAVGSMGASAIPAAAMGVGAGYAQDVASNIDEGATNGDEYMPGVGTALGVAAPLIAPVAEFVPKVLSKGKGLFSAEQKTAKTLAKVIQNNIEAINPELTSKKSSIAYQQLAKGDRTVKPSGFFTEQTLSPSEKAIAIGTRLSKGETLSDGTKINSIQLSSDNIKNLANLKTGLITAEQNLQKALKTDPLVNANKNLLTNSLNKGMVEAPRDFRIGPNKPITEDVFNFAKEVVGQIDDSVLGIREGRTLFDNQARQQYPTAFKDGAIDTKTAAGNAIKKARDIINEHLYNVAPNGSDIQKLVRHEADIYNATEGVATKASKGEGKTKISKALDAVKNSPLTPLAGAYGLYQGAKSVIGGGQ